MYNIYESIVSNFRLLFIYRDFFSVKKISKEFLNIIIGDSSFFPLTINMLITDKCNFFCKMCTRKQDEDGGTELNVDDIQTFISQVKFHQPLIHIGGGEPFMRRDLLDIVSVIKRNQLKCLITTNGFLMDESDVDAMIELKVDVLIFSLYGWGDLHDEITGVKGSFDRTIKNLKSVLEKRTKHTKVFVSTLPLPENIVALKQLINNLQHLGVDGVKVENLNFLTVKEYNRSLSHKGCFNFSPSTFIRDVYFDREFIIELMELYKNIYKTYKDFVFIKPYLSKSQLINWYSMIPDRYVKCFFIAHSTFIKYNGDVIPCQFLADCILGNIRDDSLKNIWSSRNYKKLRRTINKMKPVVCTRCCKN